MVVLRLALCAGIVFALLWGGPQSFAQSRDQIQAKINEGNEQIQKLKDEISRLQKELNATSQEKQTLQNAVKGLDLSIQKLTTSISLTQAQITQKDKEIGVLSGTISTTSDKIGESQIQVADSLRQLLERDNESAVFMILGGGTLSSFFDEAATLAALRGRLQTYIHELNDLKSNLVVSKTSAEDKRKELAALQRRLSQEKQGLTIARGAQQKLLTDTQNKESAYQAQIAQKQAEQSAFEQALNELARGLNPANLGGIPKAGKGILRWPLDNVYITQPFGDTSFAKSGAYSGNGHNGVDFRASIGTPVRAALGGTVQEINQGAVQYCQYDKWVLIKHDNGLTTLYAHLSSITTSKGQRVSTGDLIGYAGNTGYATGPHLHLTLYAGSAVTFKQYTCKSGYTVNVPIAPLNAYLNPLSYLP